MKKKRCRGCSLELPGSLSETWNLRRRCSHTHIIATLGSGGYHKAFSSLCYQPYLFVLSWMTNLKQVDSPAPLIVSYCLISYCTGGEGREGTLQLLSSGLRHSGWNHLGREWNLLQESVPLQMLRAGDTVNFKSTGPKILEIKGNPEIRLWWGSKGRTLQSLSGKPAL